MRFSIKMILSLVLIFSAVSVMAQDSTAQSSEKSTETKKEGDITKFRLLYNDTSWIQFHYFLQTGYIGSNNGQNWTNDFTLETSRLILNGQAADKVYFFMQTDDITIDSQDSSSVTSSLFTRDAYMTMEFTNWFQLYAGQIAVPFTRQQIQSEASALSIGLNEFTSEAGAGAYGRDIGMMFRGFLFQDYLEYRIGAFKGFRSDSGTANIDNDDIPRFSGRLMLNFLDKEEGYFVSENYLGKREIVSLGVGLDYQPAAYNDERYLGFTMDLSAEIKMPNGDAVTGQGAVMLCYNDPASGFDGTTLNYNDYTAYYLQLGYYLSKMKTQFYTRYNHRNNKSFVTMDTLTAGMGYYLEGHNANFKMEYSHPVFGADESADTQNYKFMFQVYLF